MSLLVSFDDIKDARARLHPAVRRTPIIPVARNGQEIGNERLFIKCENLQVTGAYKIRAAFTMLDRLTAEQKSKGVVLTSSGNFAQGFAYAGRLMNVPIAVVMLRETARTRLMQREIMVRRSSIVMMLWHVNRWSTRLPKNAA